METVVRLLRQRGPRSEDLWRRYADACGFDARTLVRDLLAVEEEWQQV